MWIFDFNLCFHFALQDRILRGFQFSSMCCFFSPSTLHNTELVLVVGKSSFPVEKCGSHTADERRKSCG